MPPPPPFEQSLLLSSWGEEGLCLNGVRPFESPHAQTLLSNWFFECEHSFIDTPMVITEPVVPSARLLGIGSTLYLSNMQRCRQNQASERKALLAGRRLLAVQLTFSVQGVSNINNLLTVSVHYQQKKLWELTKWSPKGKWEFAHY